MNKKTDDLNSPKSDPKEEKRKIIRAEINLNTFTSSAIAINQLNGDDLDEVTIMREMADSARLVKTNNLGEIEGMLMTQAKTLEYFFYKNLRELRNLRMINQIQAIADLALSAQNQSRKTLIALAELKHPRRTTFIKQQNNAVNQQVNNEIPAFLATKKEEKEIKSTNELLEMKKHEQWMDTTTQGTPIKIDSSMETMESVNWRNNP
ncbi:hypothetical protein [Legionella brunensis]|uniref:Uncharacterized protein n=1 Tax=Legionella brunensis TaxID=29422 RepID=A0A0W0SKB7_9GAMM|nr:hypothetical protein [Legionella brunensis]KTC83774.1 hypothetical protein Lbru_1597 [Legionella brunensis]